MKTKRPKYPSLISKKQKAKKLKEVVFSTAHQYAYNIDSRSEDFYNKIAIYILILNIRDLLYKGTNNYLKMSKINAISWFKEKSYKKYFGYGTVCQILELPANKLWLQIRRWYKVNPQHLFSMMKGIESGIFDGPRFSNLRRSGNVQKIKG